MARNRGKKALYEVMSKARVKPGHGRTLEQMHPKKPDEDSPATEQKSAAEMPKTTVRWWRKPRIIQFNAGRIEFSMSYPVIIAIILAIVLAVLVAFRIGQYYSFSGREGTTSNSGGNINNTNKANGNINTNKANMSETTKKVLPDTKNVEPTMTTGSNVIVLVEYSRRADLVPVQKHFAQFGIETEIMNWSGKYFLITKDRFESFGPGSEGYQAKQKIIAAGALYKGQAPEGYETFSPHFFKDAYGKKVD